MAEWLAGRNSAPLRRERGIAIGDMPVFGAGSAANTGNVAGSSGRGVASQNLQLLEMERERAREKREAQDRDRKSGLEGEKGPRAPNPVLPFEDFDLRATLSADKGGVPMLQRSLTAGPGEYDLIVGWADASAKDPATSVRVFKRPLDLPIASTTAFSLSGVIIADDVSLREVPIPADRQTAHPYSIGTTEIVAGARSIADDRRAARARRAGDQPARWRPTASRMSRSAFGIQRRTANGHEQVGVLAPQTYNRTTLPPDFDVNTGNRSSPRWRFRSARSSAASIASRSWPTTASAA